MIGFLAFLFCVVAGCRPDTEGTFVIEAELFNGRHDIGSGNISVVSVGSYNDGNVLVGLLQKGRIRFRFQHDGGNGRLQVDSIHLVPC
jgi:hypothetical protein